MKFFSKESPYYYPLTRSTMKDLFFRTFAPFEQGMSTTFLVKRGFGGGKAYTRFMVDHVDELAESAGLSVSGDTHVYVYIDPDELAEGSGDAFWKLFFQQYEQVSGGGKDITRIAEFREDLGQLVHEKEVVFVLRGLNDLPFADKHLLGTFNTMLLYSQRVHFLFVLYEGGTISIPDSRFDRIRSLISQNVVRMDTLSVEDETYVITRWGYALEHDFTKKERRIIKSTGRGHPSILKACCFAVAQDGIETVTELKKHPQVAPLMERAFGGEVVQTALGDDARRRLSSKEYEVYAILIQRKGGVVYKDDIADVLWGDDAGILYSEAAIVQVIRRIKKKMNITGETGVTIRAVYGKGYVLEKGG